jgi:uroporphyrinogen III methyltransferase/synthase
MAAGRPPDTPVAVVRWGTRPEQATVRTTLAEVGAAALEAPATIVVGAVAGLDLRWFESRPLFGRRVVVTRPAGQAEPLVGALRAAGAEPVVVPAVETVAAEDGGAALGAAVAEVGTYDWVVFTSANAVEHTFAHLHDARSLGGVKVAAVGSATAAALEPRGVMADLVPAEFVAEALVAAFPTAPPGGRVLLPRSASAREVVADGLAAKGWVVTAVDAYRTVPASVSERDRRRVAEADAVTFTSGSTVDGLVAACGIDGLPPVVVCIGPVAAGACEHHGIEVAAVADPHTVAGLVAALVREVG